MTPDPWLLAAAVVGLAGVAIWWVWALNRDTNKRIDTLATTTRNNSGAIIQLQTTVADTPLQVHSPMPKVGGGAPVKAQPWGRENGPELFVPHGAAGGWDSNPQPPAPKAGALSAKLPPDSPGSPSVDPTLRLGRPPALSDIEAVLAKAARPLTRMEMAAELERQPWELLGDLKRLMLDGRLALSPSHGAEAAYTLADPTTRMASMPILWGAR